MDKLLICSIFWLYWNSLNSSWLLNSLQNSEAVECLIGRGGQFGFCSNLLLWLFWHFVPKLHRCYVFYAQLPTVHRRVSEWVGGGWHQHWIPVHRRLLFLIYTVLAILKTPLKKKKPKFLSLIWASSDYSLFCCLQ